MANTIQINRTGLGVAVDGEYPNWDKADDPDIGNLDYGELAWNNGAKKLFIARVSTIAGGLSLQHIGGQVGIADTNILRVDQTTSAAEHDYAKFTAAGIVGRDYAEVKQDLSLNNVENTALSTWAGTTNITTLGTIAAHLVLNSKQIQGVADPTSAQHAATKAYVDGVAQGLTIIDPCYHATTAALPACTYANGTAGVGATLTGDANGALTIDGTGASAGKRVLVKNQVAEEHNGIYTVTTAGSGSAAFVLTRATDYDQQGEVLDGDFCFIQTGTANGDRGFVQTSGYWTSGTGTFGTHDITWVQFSGAGQITDGFALLKTGDTLDVQTGTTATTVSRGDHNHSGTYLESETSHADVVVDGDFGSEGFMKRGSTAGTYSIVTDSSSNWDAAHTHVSATTNPHSVTKAQVGLTNVEDTALSTATIDGGTF